MSNKKHRSKQIGKKIETTRIFNLTFIIFVLSFLILILFSLSFFSASNRKPAIVCLVIAAVAFIGVVVNPAYFVFSEKNVTCFWMFLQFKRIIPWGCVTFINERRLGERDVFDSVAFWPEYEIIYNFNYKGIIITKSIEIQRSKKTKKSIEKYEKHKIV